MRVGDPLQLHDQHIDFTALAETVDARTSLGDRGRGGRPSYPTELIIRLLVLRQLYHLSDDAMQYQLLDRASFLRFVGLEQSGRVPDAKTLWLWGQRLKKKDLIGDISVAGLIARGGQIIDASIISASVQRNRCEENEAIACAEVPVDWNAAKRVQKDVQARWTRKNGKSYYGYKLYANSDRRWGFIR